MEFQWPPFFLENTTYYIALYFADDIESSPDAGPRRTIDIAINGVPYYSNLNVTSAGVVVFTSQWPLSGFTRLKVAPSEGSVLGPLINAGEIFQVLQLGRRTHTKDGMPLDNPLLQTTVNILSYGEIALMVQNVVACFQIGTK